MPQEDTARNKSQHMTTPQEWPPARRPWVLHITEQIHQIHRCSVTSALQLSRERLPINYMPWSSEWWTITTRVPCCSSKYKAACSVSNWWAWSRPCTISLPNVHLPSWRAPTILPHKPRQHLPNKTLYKTARNPTEAWPSTSRDRGLTTAREDGTFEEGGSITGTQTHHGEQRRQPGSWLEVTLVPEHLWCPTKPQVLPRTCQSTSQWDQQTWVVLPQTHQQPQVLPRTCQSISQWDQQQSQHNDMQQQAQGQKRFTVWQNLAAPCLQQLYTTLEHGVPTPSQLTLEGSHHHDQCPRQRRRLRATLKHRDRPLIQHSCPLPDRYPTNSWKNYPTCCATHPLRIDNRRKTHRSWLHRYLLTDPRMTGSWLPPGEMNRLRPQALWPTTLVRGVPRGESLLPHLTLKEHHRTKLMSTCIWKNTLSSVSKSTGCLATRSTTSALFSHHGCIMLEAKTKKMKIYHHLIQKAAAAHGGIATMRKPELDPYVTRTDEGNCRISLTTFNIPDNHLCIINCYLPSRSSPQAISKYREDVDVLYELTVKYHKKYDVLLIGDFNKDHFNRKRPEETLIKELIEELGLKDLGTSTASESTYINHNLVHASHIDHALIKSHIPASWNPVEVSKEDKVENAANSSTHMPINVSLCMKSILKHRQPQQQDGTKR